ncbi:DegQ family serine endoprotease [Rickettsiales bacterium]|nr:DegQ family serine endoprotease [Rickettsiales bacterium]
MKKNVIILLSLISFLIFDYSEIKSHPLSDDFANLVSELSPAVVNVFTTQVDNKQQSRQSPSPFDDIPPQFRDFFKNMPPGFPFGDPQDNAPRNKEAPQALGSGFVIDPTGFIVTNHHVISQATEIKVKFQNEKELKAKLIGKDQLTDLALLKVESKNPLPFVKFADSDKARVGHSVIAIGNPFGLGGTVTSGIISAFNRDINSGPYDSFIQTDASINKGNSGGPLFNLKGEVVGINSAIFSPTGGSVGIGFSIPANLAKPIIAQLKKYGKTQRGWLGVRIQEITPDIAKSLGLKNEEGVLISMVNPGEPADKAGVKAGDVILKFNDKEIKNVKALQRTVAESAVESSAKISVWRNRKIKNITVKLGELEKFTKLDNDTSKDSDKLSEAEIEIEKVGLRFKDLTLDVRTQYKIPETIKGIVITAVKNNSPASDVGIRVGNVISQIAQVNIESAEQAKKIINKSINQNMESILIQIFQDGFPKFAPLKLK